MMTIFRLGLCTFVLEVLLAGQAAHAQSAALVSEWNQEMLAAIQREATAPGLAARNLAILHSALHDGLEAVHGGGDFILSQHDVKGGIDEEIFLNVAASRLLAIFYPSYRTVYEKRAEEALEGIPEPTKSNSARFAEEVVRKSLQVRAGDGSANTLTYIPKDGLGLWRRTPPSYRPPELSHWSHLEPFVLPDANTFRPPPPPALDSLEYAQAFQEVKQLGGKGGESPDVNPEFRHLADYWSCFSYSSTPAGHWNEILANILAERNDYSLSRAARAFAILNVAMADAGIAAWDCKYHYEFWRPVHAIRLAGKDGNAETSPDADWDSYLEAPPHPEYVSGHSTFSAAGAAVLENLFGTDNFTFVSTNPLFPGEKRVYHSFSSCAMECGISRIYGGIHFSFSNDEGLKLGRQVGQYVFQNLFQ